MFRDPISEAEGDAYRAWHACGLSPREMREMTEDSEVEWGHPARTTNTIARWLGRNGLTPNPSPIGVSPDIDPFCRRHDPPVAKKGKKLECFTCKTQVDRVRTARVRTDLANRLTRLRELGGESAEIAEWIAAHVHPR